jgi:hypothetical protein
MYLMAEVVGEQPIGNHAREDQGQNYNGQYDFNVIPGSQSFLDFDLPALDHDPNLDHAPIQPEDISVQDAETVAVDLFVETVREHSQQPSGLNDGYIQNLIRRMGHLPHEEIDALADIFLARGRALFESIRTHTSDPVALDVPHVPDATLRGNWPGMTNTNMLVPDALPSNDSTFLPHSLDQINGLNYLFFERNNPVSVDLNMENYDFSQDHLTLDSTLSSHFDIGIQALQHDWY